MESLDNILSGKGESTPEPEKQEVAQESGQETETEQTLSDPQEGGDKQRTVPHEALHAEKQKTKRYTEEVASLRQEISERDAAWERRIAQLVQANQPKQEAQPVPDWFENPTEATRHHVTEQVSPVFEQFSQQLLAIAKDNAIGRFTEEKVDAAEKAFVSAMQNRQLDPADYQKVVSSPNRYAAAVQWHSRQLAQAEIGDDPAAYKAKLESEILEKYGIKPGEQDKPASVMPSNLAGARNVGNRSGPAWAGPPTLTDIFKR